MLLILPRTCNVFSFRGWRHWGAWIALFDARGSIHCAVIRRSPKRCAPGQNQNAWRKKTAFAGRFFRKPQLAAVAWYVSRTTLAWGHSIKLCLSLQRYFPSIDSRHMKASLENFGVLSDRNNLTEITFYKNTSSLCLGTSKTSRCAEVSRLICRRSHANAAVRFGRLHNSFTPSDTVLHPCRNVGSGGTQPAASWTTLACMSEGSCDPVSALEVWPPTWRPKRMKLFLRTLSLVWRSFQAFRFYEFLRDHFDDLK